MLLLGTSVQGDVNDFNDDDTHIRKGVSSYLSTYVIEITYPIHTSIFHYYYRKDSGLLFLIQIQIPKMASNKTYLNKYHKCLFIF